MPETHKLQRFVEGGISVFVGTADADHVPTCCRAIALATKDGFETVTVYVPAATAQETIANVATTRRVAIAATEPLSHGSIQIKGVSRGVRLAPPSEEAFVRTRLHEFADVLAELGLPRREGYLTETEVPNETVSPSGLRTEIRGLQLVSDRINRADDLETLLAATLDALDVFFGMSNTIVLLSDEPTQKLITIACRGYGGGVGAEVAIGEGLIGTVARERRVLRMSGLDEGLRYGRAVRRSVLSDGGRAVRPEIPLPGLPDAQSALILPLLIEDRLVGILAAESRDPMAFGEWDEAYLGVIANQIALGIDRMTEDDAAPAEPDAPPPPRLTPPPPVRARHTLTYYRDDDCVFLDDEYLVRNVPGRILWKLLGEWKREGRTAFTNRELRMDRNLGLPEVKDNLESRLILLKHRLREKCPNVQISPAGRGKFTLDIAADLQLVER